MATRYPLERCTRRRHHVGEKMNPKRDYVAEIEEKRERNEQSVHDAGIANMLILQMQTDHLQSEGVELAYFPVAAVAAIESYFKAEIIRLIDSGDTRFINNIPVDELPLKISQKLLLALHGRRVSVGELVAHVARLSSLESIGKTMTQLLGSDFFALVKDARDPWDRRNLGDSAPPVIQSVEEVFADVKRTYRLRHIICHEAPLKQVVRADEIKRICSSCYNFLRASYYAVAYHRNPQPPLTLEESFHTASELVEGLENEIRSVEKAIGSHLGSSQKAFSEMQESWRNFVERQAYFDTCRDINGSRGMVRAKQLIANEYQKRLDALKRHAHQLEEDSDHRYSG